MRAFAGTLSKFLWKITNLCLTFSCYGSIIWV
nr:MAG TPA: hypothetical protein [Caudoviricetes sp.]